MTHASSFSYGTGSDRRGDEALLLRKKENGPLFTTHTHTHIHSLTHSHTHTHTVLLPNGLASNRGRRTYTGDIVLGNVRDKEGDSAANTEKEKEAVEDASSSSADEMRGASGSSQGMSLSYAKQCLENALLLLSVESPPSDPAAGMALGLSGAGGGVVAGGGSHAAAGAGGGGGDGREKEGAEGSEVKDDPGAMATAVAAHNTAEEAERLLFFFGSTHTRALTTARARAYARTRALLPRHLLPPPPRCSRSRGLPPSLSISVSVCVCFFLGWIGGCWRRLCRQRWHTFICA